MAQGPTNVNLIATYIHNNPGCRRVDLKRMLHRAAHGQNETSRDQLNCKNQYFQRYGSPDAGNVYLDRLWHNLDDRGRGKTRKSRYYLTWAGEDKVWHRPMRRPFEEGSIVEWQWNSPNNPKYKWQAVMQGLVVERTELYGLWVLPIGIATREDGKLVHVSHQAFVRRIYDQT